MRKYIKRRRPVAEDELETTDATIDATSTSSEQDANTQIFNDKDIDDMTDAEVMNYAFINIPKNIDTNRKQQLLQRVSDISNKQDVSSGTDHGNFVKQFTNYATKYKNDGGGLQEDE